MNVFGSPLAPYAADLTVFHDRCARELAPIEQFFEILAQPYRPECLTRIEDDMVWTRLIRLFIWYGVDEEDFKRLGVDAVTRQQWQNGVRSPADAEYQKKLIGELITLLHVRANVHT